MEYNVLSPENIKTEVDEDAHDEKDDLDKAQEDTNDEEIMNKDQEDKIESDQGEEYENDEENTLREGPEKESEKLVDGKHQKHVCQKCHKVYNYHKTLMNHTTTCGTKYLCEVCHKKCNTKNKLKKHMLTHDKDKGSKYICTACGRVFPLQRSLKYHIQSTHTKDYICENCEKKMSSHYALMRHQKVCRGKDEFLVFKKNTDITGKHVVLKIYKCPQCSYQCKKRDNLIRHLRTTHEPSTPFFICEMCGKGLRRKEQIKEHFLLCLGNGTECRECGDKFESTSQLKDHIIETHFVHSCDQCGKKFARKLTLRKHIFASHSTGDSDYSCSKCGRNFMYSSCLKKHIATNTSAEGVLTCKEAESDQRKRRKLGEPKVPITCKYCSKLFYHKTEHDKHIRCHTGEKPYVCECGHRTGWAVNLKRHKLTHIPGYKRGDPLPANYETLLKQNPFHSKRKRRSPNVRNRLVSNDIQTMTNLKDKVEHSEDLDKSNIDLSDTVRKSDRNFDSSKNAHPEIVHDSTNTCTTSTVHNSTITVHTSTNTVHIYDMPVQNRHSNIAGDIETNLVGNIETNMKNVYHNDRFNGNDHSSDNNNAYMEPNDTSYNNTFSSHPIPTQYFDHAHKNSGTYHGFDRSKISHLEKGLYTRDWDSIHDSHGAYVYGSKIGSHTERMHSGEFVSPRYDFTNYSNEPIDLSEYHSMQHQAERYLSTCLEKDLNCLEKNLNTRAEEYGSSHINKGVTTSGTSKRKKYMPLKNTRHDSLKDSHKNELKPYHCIHCPKNFRVRNALKMHMRFCKYQNQEDLKPFQCVTCMKRFKLEKTLKLHMEQVQCTEQDRSTSTKESVLECKNCRLVFESRELLRSHKELCRLSEDAVQYETVTDETGNAFLKCLVCDVQYKTEITFKSHMITEHTGNYPFLCTTCGKGFTRKSKFKDHSLWCCGNSTKCEKCNEIFETTDELHVHVKQAHLRQFQCDRCAVVTATKNGLLTHMERVHNVERLKFKKGTGGKSHYCELCDRFFASHLVLQNHLKLHEISKPFTCESCNKSFVLLKTLKNHYQKCADRLQAMGNVDLLTCSYCKKVFKSKSDYKKHIRSHTGEKPFKCDDCGFKTSWLVNLKRHKLTHIPGYKRGEPLPALDDTNDDTLEKE